VGWVVGQKQEGQSSVVQQVNREGEGRGGLVVCNRTAAPGEGRGRKPGSDKVTMNQAANIRAARPWLTSTNSTNHGRAIRGRKTSPMRLPSRKANTPTVI